MTDGRIWESIKLWLYIHQLLQGWSFWANILNEIKINCCHLISPNGLRIHAELGFIKSRILFYFIEPFYLTSYQSFLGLWNFFTTFNRCPTFPFHKSNYLFFLELQIRSMAGYREQSHFQLILFSGTWAHALKHCPNISHQKQYLYVMIRHITQSTSH